MPRQGRQPKQLTGASTQRKQRPAQPAQTKGKGKSAPRSTATHLDDDEPSALDVYAYKARVRRPRGDVDPLAKASAKKDGGKKQQQQGKGKGRAPVQDDDDEQGEDDDDEDLSDDDGFRVHGEEVVEWTGRKPVGFKLGMDSDAEEGGKFDDEDEEIDSDLASGSEDDLPRKNSSGKKGKKGHERKSADVDLDEDEIDWDDENGAGWMDLTEMLDAGGYPSGSEGEDESGSGSDDHEEDEDEDGMSMDDDDESEITSDDEGALDKLDSFVEGLDSKKRKAGDDGDDAGGKKKKRVVLKERTEALPEGEFAAVNADEGKVNLDDLLSGFSDSKNPRLASLRKSLKPLTGSSSSTDKLTTTNSHLKSSGALAAPLPGRLQDKIDREAAYEKTKEETDKWNETVRRMKGESGLGVEGARHERLTLPLMGGAGDVRRDPNAQEWSAKFQPTNELEASIQNLLAAGQMSQSDIQKREQQELAQLDPAELAARQAELRRQRDLMYRAERKAKRVAKIKSKAYRRIHRKSKDKNGENGPQLSLEDLAELDAIDGGNRVDEERTRLELLRAKERATLKHSSKGGRWAKKIDGLEGLEEERNASIRDMVARREELRRKIAGVGSDEEVDEFASSGSDNGDSDDEGGDFDSVRRKAFDELALLDAKEAAAKASDPKLKGVMNMKFMRDAMARADRDVQKEADELRGRLARMDEMAEGGESGDEEEVAGAQVQGNLGRMVFGPSGAGQALATEDASLDAAPKSSTTTKLSSVSIASPLIAAATASSSRPTPRSRPSLSNPISSAVEESNPWLTLADSEPSSSSAGGAKLSRKLNKASFGKDSASAADKSASKAARARGKQADAREADREDARIEIDVSGEAALSVAATAKKGKGAKGKEKAQPQIGGALVARPAEGMEHARENDEDESDGEMDDEEIDAQRGKGPAAFRQRALVKEAFANDDVVADFAEAKRKEIERDAPREEDNTLPGWGSWGGKGAKKQKNPRKFITKVAGVDADKRQDAGLNHVIISEKKDRKASKYMLKDLPFPYTSAAQHEHKLRTPMGPEWSTSTILRDQTMPSVLIKPGVSIRPVDKKVQ
ncbi:hypothetical protein JCM6882_003934 [Rhodosporidiobolus microsporus]